MAEYEPAPHEAAEYKTNAQSFRELPLDVEPAHNQREIITGYLLAFFGAALFSTKAIFIKTAYQEASELAPLTLLAIRMGFALPLYALILVWALRKRQKTSAEPLVLSMSHIVMAVLMGMIGYYLASMLDFTGLLYITAQLERLILFTYPMFIMVLGALFFGKTMTRKGVISMALAYTGIAIVFLRGSIASGDHVVVGSLLVVGAALSFAFFQLLATGHIKKIGSVVFTCIAMMGAGAGILLHFIVAGLVSGQLSAHLSQPVSVWLIGAGIGVVATLLPSFMINIALGRIGAQAVAVLGMVSPIITIVLAVVLLNEPFMWVDGLGTVITIIGIGFYTWFDRKKRSDGVVKSTP
jgi:drug/metabolite transporter (DMT)-like permease